MTGGGGKMVAAPKSFSMTIALPMVEAISDL